MYTVQYDMTQVLACCATLQALLEPEAKNTDEQMHQLVHDVVDFITHSVKEYGHLPDSAEVNAGLLTVVLWPLPADKIAEFGHTHEVSLYINPTPSFCEATNRDSAYVSVEVEQSANDPRRLRYIHVRNYKVLMIGETAIHSELLLRGGYTVCFRDNLDGTLTYSVAKCNKHDAYVKSVGRDLSSKLLKNGSSKRVTMTINEFRPWIEAELAKGNWK